MKNEVRKDQEVDRLAKLGHVSFLTGEIQTVRDPYSLRCGVSDLDCQAVVAAERELAKNTPGYKFEEARTEQSHERDCNINNIVAQFHKSGDLSLLQRAQGMFMDLTQLPIAEGLHAHSYQNSLDFVIQVGQAFDALPATVRASYDNDPAKFMDAANKDPEKVFKDAAAMLATTSPGLLPELPKASPEALKEVPPSKEEKK